MISFCYAMRCIHLLIDMQGRENCDPMMNEAYGKGSRRWRSTWCSLAGGYAGKMLLILR